MKCSKNSTKYFTSSCVEYRAIRVQEIPSDINKLEDPKEIYHFWNETITKTPWFDPEREQVVAIMVSTKLRPIGFTLVSLGTLNESLCHPREVFRSAIIANAYGVILAHNHPSGDPTPSRGDHLITRNTHEAGKTLKMPLIDHVIIGKPISSSDAFYSFKSAGII